MQQETFACCGVAKCNTTLVFDNNTIHSIVSYITRLYEMFVSFNYEREYLHIIIIKVDTESNGYRELRTFII